MDIVNRSPFEVDRFAIFDREGAETLVVVVKGTFELDSGAPPEIAEDQDPIVQADEYAGEPEESGLLAAAELLPPKPGTDVLLTAHAIPARRRGAMAKVAVRVADRSQTAIVYGDRVWKSRLGFLKISDPEPFDRMPLTWENAFGGADATPKNEKHHTWEPRNPVGKGLFAKKTEREIEGSPVPNIDHPKMPYRSAKDRPSPVGFLPVAPSWQPRLQYAGTYDDAWMKKRAPLLPDDFDERFHLTAPEGLRAERFLKGGERCSVLGTTPEGRLEFRLPRARPTVRLRFPAAAYALPLEMDTVHIDTDRMRLHLIWRGMKPLHGRLDSLNAVEADLDGKEEVS